MNTTTLVRVAALSATLATAFAQEPAQKLHADDVEATWWLELAGPTAPDRTSPPVGVLIRADGGKAHFSLNAIPAPFPGWSPDRRHNVLVERDRERNQRDLVVRPVRVSVIVSDPSQLGPRREVRLTNDHDDLDPFWSKDSRSVFFHSDRGGDGWQLWRIAADGSGTPERLTEGDAKVHRALLSPDGREVLLVRATERPPERRQGMRTRDLDVSILDLETGAVRTLVGDVFTAEAAWSPDGARVACGVDATVAVYDTATGARLRSWESGAIHEAAYSHGASAFLWRPDGEAFACKLHFLGQTSIMAGEAEPKMFGDDEVFVLGLDGSATTLSPPANEELRAAWTGRLLAWRRLPR